MAASWLSIESSCSSHRSPVVHLFDLIEPRRINLVSGFAHLDRVGDSPAQSHRLKVDDHYVAAVAMARALVGPLPSGLLTNDLLACGERPEYELMMGAARSDHIEDVDILVILVRHGQGGHLGQGQWSPQEDRDG